MRRFVAALAVFVLLPLVAPCAALAHHGNPRLPGGVGHQPKRKPPTRATSPLVPCCLHGRAGPLGEGEPHHRGRCGEDERRNDQDVRPRLRGDAGIASALAHQPKISEVDVGRSIAACIEQHIRGFDIAVDQTLLMSIFDRI